MPLQFGHKHENDLSDAEDIKSWLAIGSANRRYISCCLEGAEHNTNYYISPSITNVDATDFRVAFQINLPLELGSYKLNLDAWKVGIYDADPNNKITQTVLRGYGSATSVSDLETDNNAYDSTGDHTNTFTAIDCSTYNRLILYMYVSVNAANNLDISYAMVRYYYE